MSDLEAVHVHIASSDVPIGQQPGKLRTATFYTLALTEDQPVQQVLRPDPNRVIAYVQAGGANVVLTKSKGEAQANVKDPAYLAPTGMLLPFGNSAPYPLDTTSEVWAASAVYPAQVSVTVITRADS